MVNNQPPQSPPEDDGVGCCCAALILVGVMVTVLVFDWFEKFGHALLDWLHRH